MNVNSRITLKYDFKYLKATLTQINPIVSAKAERKINQSMNGDMTNQQMLQIIE